MDPSLPPYEGPSKEVLALYGGHQLTAETNGHALFRQFDDLDKDGRGDSCEECAREPLLFYPRANNEVDCSDGVDNDCDLKVDCSDKDCYDQRMRTRGVINASQ